jgi:hypothetical protein
MRAARKGQSAAQGPDLSGKTSWRTLARNPAPTGCCRRPAQPPGSFSWEGGKQIYPSSRAHTHGSVNSGAPVLATGMMPPSHEDGADDAASHEPLLSRRGERRPLCTDYPCLLWHPRVDI